MTKGGLLILERMPTEHDASLPSETEGSDTP